MQICKHNDGKGRCAVSGEHCTDGPCDCEELVEYEPVRHGVWVVTDKKECWHYCSECGCKPIYKYPYCPNCGAEMKM